jgi:uncharacterized protein
MSSAANKEYDQEANVGVNGFSQPAEEQTAPVARVVTSGNNNEFVHIGGTKVYKHELLAAFGGTLNPQVHTSPSRKFANPSPIGLCGFALTTFVLSLINIHARHVTTPNIVVGLAFFYGGAVQLIAGIWEIVVENTFGAVALMGYGGFWMSYAAIYVPSFGIIDAYASDPSELDSAVGFFLIGWFIFDFMLVLCTLRSTVAFFSLFFFLDLTFLLLACGAWTGHVGVTKAGGWFGIITALIAWYNAFAGIANSENFFFNIKPIPMPFAKKIE